jgi:hypothetical protein
LVGEIVTFPPLVVVRLAFSAISAPLIEMLPATLTAPVTVMFPAVEFKVSDCGALVDCTVFETVIAPAVSKVALAELI